MQQYRITSADILLDTSNDCVLPENDPAWELIASNPTSKIGFDPKNPTKSQTTEDAEGGI